MSQETANDQEFSAEEIAKKLERRYGLGSQPSRRLAFFKRLGMACEIHGERAYVTIRTLAAEADGARMPDRYFCRAALTRLRELGFFAQAEL